MIALFRVAFVVVVIMCGTAVARADYKSSARWFDSLSEEDRGLLQANLVLLGYYDRLIDLEFGQGTYEAILAYQRKTGQRADGVLSKKQQDALFSEASEVYGRLGIEIVHDSATGLELLLPLKLLEGQAESPKGMTYSALDGQIEVETERLSHRQGSFASKFADTAFPSDGSVVTYQHHNEADFTVAARNGDRFTYARYYDVGDASVGFTIRWTKRYRTVGSMISILLASMSYPAEAAGAGGQQIEPRARQSADTYSSGTGFFFAEKGMIATNYHVAANCTELTVVGYGPAALIRGDEASDLAAVQLDTKWSPAWAKIRPTPPQLAESVLLLGYPLADILESSLNVSTGIVSSETGPAGAKGWFTTNAGIQPGNSGGPLLDESGNVIGVAVAKIDDAALLQNAGTTASNIGFGIKSTKLLEFLDIFQHSTGTETEALTPQEISKLGKTFTVQLICRQSAETARQ